MPRSGRGKGGLKLDTGLHAKLRRRIRSRYGMGGAPCDYITKQAVRRLARRGGVVRMSPLIYGEIEGALKEFITRIVKDAVTYCDFARRKTLKEIDVIYALENSEVKLYGFGMERLKLKR